MSSPAINVATPLGFYLLSLLSRHQNLSPVTTASQVLMPWKFNGCYSLFVIDHVKKHVTFIDFTPTQDWYKHMPYKRFAEAIIMALKKYKIAYSKKRSGWEEDIFK
ncbi:hypothetical protein ZEAMMB73_Zm00001d023556 [Zea mays]|uniref:Uncharacterized protein n=1 Tax=Zea mays TaxID=4577 RepID=A0A1D6IU39_MAIZE|nr:hypothetical protein ZEAMMB73_Zm00001d023556 [Zea mays]